MKLPKMKSCKCTSRQCYIVKHGPKEYAVTCTNCNKDGPVADDAVRAVHRWNGSGFIYGHTGLKIKEILRGEGVAFAIIREAKYIRRSHVLRKLVQV